MHMHMHMNGVCTCYSGQVIVNKFYSAMHTECIICLEPQEAVSLLIVIKKFSFCDSAMFNGFAKMTGCWSMNDCISFDGS